jgi:hypothetical protein
VIKDEEAVFACYSSSSSLSVIMKGPASRGTEESAERVQ